MRKFLALAVFFALLASSVSAQLIMNKDCPHMPKPAKKEFFVDTPKGRVYLCCKGCIKKAQADLDGTYAKAYPETKKLESTTCPVSGNKLGDKAKDVIYKGYEFKVCCDDCAKKVAEKGDKGDEFVNKLLAKAGKDEKKKDEKPAEKPKNEPKKDAKPDHPKG